MEEKIAQYAHLTPAEQRDVEAYVAHHPEMAARFEEAQAWEALFREAHTLLNERPSDEALAYFAATKPLQSHLLPTRLRELFDRMENQLETDSVLQARLDVLRQRMHDLEAQRDAAAHFERLTGHRLRPLQPASPDEQPLAKTALSAPAPARVPSSSRRRLLHLGIVAVFIVGLLVGGLAAASALMQSDLDRLATFSEADLHVPEFRTAANASTSDSLRYQALLVLREARRTRLGLFRHYDAGRLSDAEALLAEAARIEAQRSPLWQEVQFTLARIYLLQDRPRAAELLLRDLVARSGQRAEEAAVLLNAMQAR